jgi:hypothetical protein
MTPTATKFGWIMVCKFYFSRSSSSSTNRDTVECCFVIYGSGMGLEGASVRTLRVGGNERGTNRLMMIDAYKSR